MRISRVVTTSFVLGLCLIPTQLFGISPTLQEPAATAQQAAEDKIQFSFQNQDWNIVVPWFANQAGFELSQIADWPEGSFTLQSSEDYSVMEALDQLNHRLRLCKPEPYTLIRNRGTLFLMKVSDKYPDELIEKIKPTELGSRGKYEIIETTFELGELDGELIYDELKQLVTSEFGDYYALFSSSNQLNVRSTGQVLRDMRDLIDDAQRKVEEEKRGMLVYRLKFQDPESFLQLMRSAVGIPGEQNSNPEGTLTMIAEQLGDRIFVTGTKKMRDEFESLAKFIDSDPDIVEADTPIAQAYFFKYPVVSDPKVAFNLFQNLLDGTESKMEQDETTGAIVAFTTKEYHDRLAEGLAILEGDQGGFAIIQMKKMDVAEARTILMNIYQQDEDSEGTGPSIIADTFGNKMIVSGSNQEVARIRGILDQLDADYEMPDPGLRSTTRIVSLNEGDEKRLMPMLETLFKTTNRPNKIRVIRPQDRELMEMRIRSGEFNDPAAYETLPGDSLLLPPPRPDRKAPAPAEGRSRGRDNQSGSLMPQLMLLGTQIAGGPSWLTTQSILWQEEDTFSDEDDGTGRDPDYQPAPKIQSVPGAPVEFKFMEGNLVIQSDDLDAIDDAIDVINAFLGEESTAQLPVFYDLEYRSVEEMKEQLEEYFGMSSGGGGGGGGGLVGGMMSNMIGGGAGDLMGSLLGGDSGGGSASAFLEGDVVFNADVRFNQLIVSGATQNDLATINELVSMWDRVQGDTDPKLGGEFFTIAIVHREAEELLDLVKKQIPDLIRDPESENKQGGGQDPARMMQELSRVMQGKGGKTSSIDSEKKKAKAVLSVDVEQGTLLIFGPPFIYKQILAIVEKLDVPDLSKPRVTVTLPPDLGDIASLAPRLKATFGNKLIFDDGSETEEGQNGRTGSAAKSPSRTSGAASQQAVQSAIMNSMMQRARAQQAGGGQRGGGQRGGGGGGGRGGRGGR